MCHQEIYRRAEEREMEPLYIPKIISVNSYCRECGESFEVRGLTQAEIDYQVSLPFPCAKCQMKRVLILGGRDAD